MALTVMNTIAGQAWIARTNCALPPLLARRLLIGITAITLIIALAFTIVGAWPILPFAGIELFAFWLALRHLQRHANDEEHIQVDATHIEIVRRHAGAGEQQVTRHLFPRYWARLRIERPPDRLGISRTRIFIRSHGREAEIGLMLTEAQRQALARELKQQLDAR